MTERGNVRVILILIFIAFLLTTQDTVLLVDETPVTNTVCNEMAQSPYPDINFISIDTLNLGSDYINIDHWSLATYNNYLYLGSSYIDNYLGKMIIVDISDPTNLIEMGRVEPLGLCAQLGVSENIVYYAEEGNRLVIFNVTDPLDVNVLGQYYIAGINGIFIDQQIAYLATDYDGLRILNVSDPSNPSEIGYYGTTTRTYRVLVQDDCAYIADTDGLTIINVSVPSSPSLIGRVDSSGYKSDISLKDDLAFITFPYTRMRLYNVSDLANPVELAEYPMSGGISELPIVDSLVFATSSVLGLQVFKFHDYDIVSYIGRFKPNGSARAVLHKEGYFYLVDNHSGLWCLEHDCDEDGLYSRQEYEVGTHSDNPDSDFDSLPDDWEVQYGTNPMVNDSLLDVDGDTLSAFDEYQLGTNPLANDTDFDALSDFAELFVHGTNPTNPDSDSDEMPDGWEVENLLNPLVNDASGDPDDDNLSNFQEFQIGTNPNNNDTDSDLMPDGWEVQNSLNPLANDSYADPDMDNLDNLFEYRIGTNPNLADSDNDGYLDNWEYYNGFDPVDYRVGVAQFLVSVLGWIGLFIAIMGVATVLWIIVQYKRSGSYDGYPYDGTSHR